MTLAGLIRRALPGALVASVAALGAGAPLAVASNTMAVQPDGKIVLAGAAPQATELGGPDVNLPALTRFNPDGGVDAGFGADGGLVDFRQGIATPFSALAVTSRSIFAGYGSYTGGYRLSRFEPDGDVDANFGAEGVASIGEGLAGLPTQLSTILPLADGTLITAGDGHRGEPTGGALAFAHQIDSEGNLVSQLGGIQTSAADDERRGSFATEQDLVRTADGSVVMLMNVSVDRGREPVLTRFAGGRRDLDFGDSSSYARLPSEGLGATGAGLAEDQAGRLLVGYDLGGGPAVARFGADGDFDETFGQDGFARVPLGLSSANGTGSIAIQPDGRILLAGWSLVPCAGSGGNCWALFVARFGFEGEVDPTFGEGGVTRITRGTDDSTQPSNVDVTALAGGTTLVSSTPGFNRDTQFIVARLGEGGGLDPSFGRGGIARSEPCHGTLAERRRSGCLSHARANLRVSGLAKGKPQGRLRVVTDNLLDPMSAVSLLLPRQLRGVPGKTKRLKAVEVPRGGRGKRVARGKVAVRIPHGARGISIGFPPGVLRRAKRVKPGLKLVFHVQVTFHDGSRQRIPVRVAT